MSQQYPSQLLEKAVGEFAKLPGIGRKTAMRLVLHLLRQDKSSVESFGNAMITLKREVKYCKVCHNISDTELSISFVVAATCGMLFLFLYRNHGHHLQYVILPCD